MSASESGEQGESLRRVEEMVRQSPGSFARRWQQGELLERLGRFEEAAGAFAEAARLDLSNPEPFFRIGNLLVRLGMYGPAVQAFDRALSRNPNHLGAAISAAVALRSLGRLGDALGLLDRRPSPDRPEWVGNRCELLLEQGRYAEAAAGLRVVPGLLCTHPWLHSNLIRALLYDPTVSARELYEEAVRWDRAHAIGPPPPPGAFSNDPAPDRPLRVGFVSSRLCWHNSSAHLLNILRHLDRSSFTILLYSTASVHDGMTETLRAEAHEWRELAALDDAQAADLIRRDRVDLLVDLNEHANNGRLALFTHKPAPVQIHWYGNAVTTGLAAMDYRLSDALTEPPGEADRVSRERILRLPTGYHCYSPPPGSVAPVPDLPCVRTGRVTFGSVHHLAKLNPVVLARWGEVLGRLPEASLLLARQSLADPGTRQHLLGRLQQAGISADRVRLEWRADWITSLRVFHEMDMVLDSAPFNGDATTCDALWMGVPVVTQWGDRLSSRRAASLLSRAGCAEWIAHTDREYVELAVAGGRHADPLQSAHRSLLDRVRACPWCDAAAVTRAIEAAFRGAWMDGFARSRKHHP